MEVSVDELRPVVRSARGPDTWGRIVTRPPDAPRRHREQYERLRKRVLLALTAR